MTIKEAIEILRNERPGCGERIVYTEGEKCEVFDTAIYALEKQIPKKPRENETRGGFLGKIKHYTCPTCGNCLLTEMMNERQNTSYCWDCGQKLDWSDTD